MTTIRGIIHYNEAFNQDKNEIKCHNSFSINQLGTQILEKDKHGYYGNYLANGINATKVTKKDKDKSKDLSYIKCYIYKEKGYYTNKCLEKSKNS